MKKFSRSDIPPGTLVVYLPGDEKVARLGRWHRRTEKELETHINHRLDRVLRYVEIEVAAGRSIEVPEQCVFPICDEEPIAIAAGFLNKLYGRRSTIRTRLASGKPDHYGVIDEHGIVLDPQEEIAVDFAMSIERTDEYVCSVSIGGPVVARATDPRLDLAMRSAFEQLRPYATKAP